MRIRINKFEMFVSSLIHKIILRTVIEENSVKRNHVNRESKSLDLTIYLNRCCEHEAPSRCNTTVYFAWLLNSEDILGGKFHTW